MPAPPAAAGWGASLPPPPSGPRLDRALTVGDVIEAMFRLLRETFAPTAAVVAILVAPGVVLLLASLTQVPDVSTAFDPSGAVSADLPEPSIAFVVLIGIGGIIALIGQAAAVPAVMQVGVDHWNDQQPRVGRALATGLKRLWGIVAVWLVMALLLILVGAAPAVLAAVTGEAAVLVLYVAVVPLLMVSGLVVVMFGYLVPGAVVAEDIGAFRAFGRVRELLRGYFWPTFGRGILIGFLLFVVNSVLSFAGAFVGFLPPEVVVVLTVLINLISYLVLTPLGVYGGLALYGDLRIRSEGADVLAMASRLRG